MKTYQLVLIVLVICAGFFFGGKYFNTIKYKPDSVPIVQEATKSELDRIMEEANFKKATILRARKVVNDNKKSAEIARNKQVMDLIEAEYQSIRAEELTLVSSASSNLK